MIEKYLTEAEWKKFSKAGDYKDAPLLKALLALAKSEKAAPAEQLKALDEIEDASAALLKAHKGDKPLAAYLPFIENALKKQRKLAQQALEAAEAAADEDEEPGSALLEPKNLLNQLNMCKRNPERTVQFGYVDGKDKQPAAFALHPKMAARKLFSKLQEASGVKTGAFGTAWIDGAKLMLQLDKPLSGLVKKVRGPVKASGFRIAKVVIWNEDGTVFEQDEEAHEGEVPADGLGTAGSGSTDEAPGTSGTVSTPDLTLQRSYETRLAALAPQLRDALRAQRGDVSKLRAVSEFALEKARGEHYEAALKALDALETLLLAAGGAAPSSSASGSGDGFSKVQFEQVHLDWESRKKEVGAILAELHAAIVEDFDDPEAASAAKELDKVLARFNEGLGDTLVELRNAADPVVRGQFASKASAIVGHYLEYLDSDPLIAHVEANPYDIEVAVKDTLSAPLSEVRARLAVLLPG